MERHVHDAEGTRWALAMADDADSGGTDERVDVVGRHPDGAHRDVRLRLDRDWHEASDDELREAILRASKAG